MAVRSQLVRALEDADVVRVKQIMECEANKAGLGDEVMELVPLVCGYMTPETQEALPHLVTSCQAALDTIATAASPKEMLMAVVEQLDTFQDTWQVTRLVRVLGSTLCRVKQTNMSVSWSWALATLGCHLRTAQEPPNLGLEGAERLSADQGEEAAQLLELCGACAEMVGILVPYCTKQTDTESPDTPHRRTVLLNFILALLTPLSTLSQHPEQDPGNQEPEAAPLLPASSSMASSLVQHAAAASGDNLWAAATVFPTSAARRLLCEDAVSPVGAATLLYLVLAEGEGGAAVPAVYTPLHLLRTAAEHVVTLLKETHEVRVHKGLLLLAALLAKVPPDSLGPEVPGDPRLDSLLPPLVTVIVHQDVAELRRLGFRCYQRYVSLFSAAARLPVYTQLLHTLTHSGLRGWTVTSLKDTLLRGLGPGATLEPYCGPRLARLVLPLLRLRDGPETDLLEVSEELLASLNLARFLLLRDTDNRTGVRDWAPDLRSWTEDISAGLQLSIAHYEHRAAHPDPAPDPGPSLGVTVGGRPLPAMDPASMQQVIRQALNTFSIIQFNLGMLKDIL